MTETPEPSFEACVARLEQIVDQLDHDALSLDRALELFEEGIVQLRAASSELGRAEAKLKLLTERVDGVFALKDLRA